MTTELKDLLWKFGIWDNLSHSQHVELEAYVAKVQAALVEARIDELRNKLPVSSDIETEIWVEKRLAQLSKKEEQDVYPTV